ncbi:MAG TPA: GH1 family beta-glucosidase [Solirubrobacteraceae bacterium]|nr:GH1 family beta-glucosidase [Solirubrobacteraceae bacterium]
MTTIDPQVLELGDGPDVETFPRTVRLGAATASYQIEGAVHDGGRGESIWDRFCRVPGAIVNGDTGDVACDHYHRFESDLDLMAEIGLECYRFSIAWPRVQPDGRGPANAAGLSFYRRLTEGLLDRGIEPIATLYHWDLPQALQDAGGWGERDTAYRFAEYAGLVADALGDEVSQWITHNEPWVVAFLGYAHGTKAPGVRHWPTALRASHHLLLSHGLALERMRASLGELAEVGIALNQFPVRPAGPGDADRDAARRMDGHLNRWFLDPLLRGSYPADMIACYEALYGPPDSIRDGDLEIIRRPIDFLGVNYYNPQRIAAAPTELPLQAHQVPGLPPTTAMGWEVDPTGLHDVLLRLRRDYGPLPVYITENGASFTDPPATNGHVDDPERTAYLQGHLAALARAIADGADVRRYCVWSLLDNFEWEEGYDKRFGIVHVDFDSQVRVPKRSALWYRDFIARVRAPREER